MSEFINTIDILGDEAVTDSIIDRTITEFNDDVITAIGANAFQDCTALADIQFPNVTSIGGYAFQNCSLLTNAIFPKVTSIAGYAFEGCTALTEVFLGITSIPWYTYLFRKCGNLNKVVFSELTSIPTHVLVDSKTKIMDFRTLEKLGSGAFTLATVRHLILRKSDGICVKEDAGNPGLSYIYVPSALIEDYKVATNWSALADKFRALEDSTVDGTTTGELAEYAQISFDVTELNFTKAGKQTINVTLTPLYALDTTVIWSSDNPNVATAYNGVVTARSNGTATITATCGSYSASCIVTVSGIKTSEYTYLYQLLESTRFNGTSDYVDTGIKLFDTPKDFTIICSGTFSSLASDRCMFHCMRESTPYPGISLDGNSGVRLCYTGSSTLTVTVGQPANITALGIRYVSGVLNKIMYRNTSGEVVTVNIAGTPIYTAVTQNLLLGAFQETNGTKGRFFNGTIDVFDVHDTALDDDTMTEILGGI